MISVIKKGTYEIIETKHKTKVLYLDASPYAWVHPTRIGEILISSHRQKGTDTKVSSGRYALYDVDDEDYLTDLQHLELEYGRNSWQGYLLPTGLPHDVKIRARIIPTDQLITNMPFFRQHVILNRPKFVVLGGASPVS